MILDLDLSGLNQLAVAAEEYGDLFYQIQQKIAGVTEVDATTILEAIAVQLGKIATMYDNLESLKISIERTSTLKIPDSIQSTADKLQLAFTEVQNSLNYLKYFVDPNDPTIDQSYVASAQMNAYDKGVINSAQGALSLFSALVQGQQTPITASNNTQVQNLKEKVEQFSNLFSDMTSVRTTLAAALAAVNGISATNP